MDNKLQELTQKLYQEGLTKGRQQADELIRKAKEEAAEIVGKAKEEADACLAKAEENAADLREQVTAEVQMASRQTLSLLRQQIENLVVTKALEKPVQDAMADLPFMEDIIATLVKAFNPDSAEGMDPEIILPGNKKESFANLLSSRTTDLFSKGLAISFDDSQESGFRIAPKGGSYIINFTEEDFIALFSRYLRPATRALLFG